MDFLLKIDKPTGDPEANRKKNHLQVVINSESEEIPQEIEETVPLGFAPKSEQFRLNFLVALDDRRNSKDPNVFSRKEFSSKGSINYGSGEHQYRRNEAEYGSEECGGNILQRGKRSGLLRTSEDLCHHLEVGPAVIENILSTLGHDHRSSETFLDTDSYY